MRTVPFFIFFLMSAVSLFAGNTQKEILLYATKDTTYFKSVVSSLKDSDYATKLNQIHVFISGQALSFQIDNPNLTHVIVHDSIGTIILNVQISKDTTVLLPTLGKHIIEIQNGGLNLRGEFDQEAPEFDPSVPTTPFIPTTLDYTINRTDDCYIIDVVFPAFEINEIILPDENDPDGHYFVKIDYPDNQIYNILDFGVLNGQPELPYFTLNLQIPEGVTIDTVTDYVEYYQDILLPYPYAPLQNTPDTETDFPLQIDEDYYDGNIINSWESPLDISDPFFSMGTTGLSVRVLPVLYYPNMFIIRPVKQIRFIICVSGDEDLRDMYNHIFEDESMADAIRFYDTYKSLDTLLYTDYKGNYLILTTEEYESDAQTYAQHKENLGFNVQVETLYSPLDSVQIRDQLKALYDDPDCRPRFALLIGSEIPYSCGVINDSTNPPTDIYYACLDEYNIESEIITPDVYVGRWPVHNADELLNIMQKSISYDFSIPERQMALFSGIDSASHNHENEFVTVNLFIHDLLLTNAPSIYSTIHNGRDSCTAQCMRDEIENNDLFMFIYRGHGYASNFGKPYNSINIYTLPDNLPFFSFAFGCGMNVPGELGTHWVNNGYRSCIFYGATVGTFMTPNSKLQKNIFKGLKENINIPIGELIYHGVTSTWADRVDKSDLAAYVLNGDPSLFIYGLDIVGNPIRYSPNIIFNSNQNETLLHDYDNIARFSIYTISGVLMYSQETDIDQQEADINAIGLQDGIYILTLQTNDNQISSRKILIKR